MILNLYCNLIHKSVTYSSKNFRLRTLPRREPDIVVVVIVFAVVGIVVDVAVDLINCCCC